MKLDVYSVSIQLIRELREPLERLRRADPNLETQIRRAATSVPLNLAEGLRRAGRDRSHLLRVAAGSAAEVRAALEVAAAWGHLDAEAVGPCLGLVDRVLAMLAGLLRR